VEFIELHHEVHVEHLLWVLELVVFLDFYQEEKYDTSIILIIYQALIPIYMVYDPFQNLYAGENQGSSCHHV
jgi:hypothetical protein